MDAYAQMELNKDKLTPRELQIYNAVVDNAELVRGSTSTELAKTLNVSQSAISRFCKKIGFSGYGDFRMSLYQAAGQQPEERQDGTEKDVADYYSDAVYEVRRELPDSLLESVARRILDARNVYISGFGASGAPATFLGTSLAQDSIRSHVVAPGNEPEMLHFTSKDDVFILFSLKNPTHRNFVYTARELNPERRPYIILITGTNSHPLRDYMDEVVVLPLWNPRRNPAYLSPVYPMVLFSMFLSHTIAGMIKDR